MQLSTFIYVKWDNKNTDFLDIRHGYSEHEVEDAVLQRKPIASRALYSLIERRLKEGLGWPDHTYNHNSVHAHSPSSTGTGGTLHDGASDVVVLDKLVHREPLLPGRRVSTQLSPQPIHPGTINGHKLAREKTNFTFDEQVLLRTNTNGGILTGGLTQEAYNELVPSSKLTSRKLFHDIILRKPSAIGNSLDSTDEHNSTKRIQNPNSFTLVRPLITTQRGNTIVPQQQQQQQQKMKPRSLPNSTLDHANQNGFHLPHDPLAGSTSGTRTPKTLSRASHAEYTKKPPPHSSMRYNPGKFKFKSFFVFISIFGKIVLICTKYIHLYVFINVYFHFFFR